MRSARSGAAFALVCGVAILETRDARAQQVDVNPPLPNAVILLDTSGSMEKMIDGTDPEAAPASTCSPGVASTPNRWGTALQSLTGSVSPYYSCQAQSRARNGSFAIEYQINGKAPYDVDYFLPWHRPASGNNNTACVVGPGFLPGASPGTGVGPNGRAAGALTKATDWPSNALASYTLGWTNDGTNTGHTCTFNQFPDGILDSARDMIRFGLMTYDQDTAGGTGTDAFGISVQNTPNSPFDGAWSYFAGWNSNGAAMTGHPADCTAAQLFEVGARNPGAPPWEGRFVTLPSDPAATLTTIEAQNDQIQQAIVAMRPYGATPTAGMFADAEYYFWNDPSGPQQTDPFVQGNCRDEYIIHITDGAPNLDLRPACAASPVDPTKPGLCPYKLPEDIALELSTGGANKHAVKTYVIGFAVSSVKDGNTLVQCSSLVTNGTLSSVCADPSKQALYGACCELERIALAGGTTSAYFADTPGDLNKALGTIIANIASNQTTRTVPAFSPVVGSPSVNANQKVTNASLFLASFAPIPGKPWTGNVQRERYQCTLNNGTYTVPPPVITKSAGDDYNDNLLQQGTSRQFRTVKAEAVNGTIASNATLRMNISKILPGVHGDDHLGTYGTASALVGTSVSTLTGSLTAAHLNITNTSCPNASNSEFLTAASCKNLAINFLTAMPTTDAMPDQTFAPFSSRSAYPMGDIFHATPAIIPPPSALIRDESYQTFASTWSTRPTVVYAPTNDGLLHAFNAQTVDDGTTRDTSEYWSFVPPAVLPQILGTYPGNHQLLLDGAPIVRDVVFDRAKGTLLGGNDWHTALVAGFGAQQRGYYALDVTDPSPSTDLTKGPQFLWQLTSVPPINNNPDRALFGQHSGTPAVTTVFVDLDGSGPHEVGVAILPGGIDSSAVGGSCKRYGSAGNDAAPAGWTRRDYVRCWAAANQPVPGRSLTIVRLDTGEVLRTFSRWADAPQALIDAKRVGLAETPLDSPMTGVPVVYPSEAGAVAQKVFIGDADGTMWRFNLTDPNPRNWVGELYLDAYNQKVDSSSNAYADGQPIQIYPVLAVDRRGQLVVTFATGDTETYTATGTNFVYSTTETSDGTKLRASVNWYLPFLNGERVSGPMAIFDSVLYFSTYAAGSNLQSCSGGVAKMWGRDFVTPKDVSDLSVGGVPKLQNPVVPTNPLPDYVAVASVDPTLAGKVIPGVSVNFTPACASLTSSPDNYVGGNHYTASNVTSGDYSLLASAGAKNGNGGVKLVGGGNGITLPRPKTSTIVDSWAAVVE